MAHQADLFTFLRECWQDLFRAEFEVLLYDLTSTYFECDPPASGKRRFGYRRDQRPDCVQVIIALGVTPEGLPLAYEMMAGNTSEKTTLKGFLEKIERQYGRAKRTWVMDRSIPTEEVLKEMWELARLWQHYLQLTEIEAVFRDLKSDLAIRPIYHQKDSRIEAHIFRLFPGLLSLCHPSAATAGFSAGANSSRRDREDVSSSDG